MHYRVLTAFFGGRTEAEGAVSQLLERGVPHAAIRLLPKEVTHLDDLGVKVTSKASEGAALGAASGGLLGAALGMLTAAGSLVLPRLDMVIAGPLVSALAGAGALGGIATLLGALIGASIPEYEAAYLDDAVGRGGSLLAIRCREEEVRTIEHLLRVSGARRIRRSAAQLDDRLAP